MSSKKGEKNESSSSAEGESGGTVSTPRADVTMPKVERKRRGSNSARSLPTKKMPDLPKLKEVSLTQRQEVFRQKLLLCEIRFDFNNPMTDEQRTSAEIKRNTLNELVEFVSSPTSQKFFTESYIDESIKINLRKTLRSCRANLIHSFDGAIIREFSRRFKKKGYNILTIHDCIQYNPNAAKLFEQIVKDIYIHNNIIEDFYNCAFMHCRKSLEENLLGDFDKLVAELYAESKLTHISESLNYDSLYELE